MKNRNLSFAPGCAIVLAAFVWPSAAVAVELSTVVSPVYQVGTGSQVRIGHTALASTNYNRLYAGGSYTAVCGGGEIAQVTGANYLSAENYLGRLQLAVTIPQIHPAYVNLTGFYNVSGGQTIHCSYNWISRAEEGGYTVGAGGISFQTGNGRSEQGGSQPFVMVARDVDEGSTCIP
jgi:hypothetical protein